MALIEYRVRAVSMDSAQPPSVPSHPRYQSKADTALLVVAPFFLPPFTHERFLYIERAMNDAITT
jgi:hypothetical protein